MRFRHPQVIHKRIPIMSRPDEADGRIEAGHPRPAVTNCHEIGATDERHVAS